MLELSSSIKEDVKQINDVEVVVTESMNFGKVLLEDILTDDKQNNDIIAENFSNSMETLYFKPMLFAFSDHFSLLP